ncbi:MAG: TetR/AcrR family transcriptional regulator [Halioglobus sp.]|nr:TetR/AcrR family transcriptional regulator [Halioglobus sp.]
MAKQSASEPHKYHHGDLKQALLDETARILREEGEAALSLRRLATNVGVSRTAPYNHFENKDALLSAVAEEGFRRFEKAMKDVRRKHRNSTGNEIMRALVQAYLTFALNNPEYYDLMYGRKSWREGVQTASLATTARSVLRQDIERLKKAQKLQLVSADVDVVYFERILWGTMHGISRLCLDGVYSDSVSVKKLCNNTADMLWQLLDPAR